MSEVLNFIGNVLFVSMPEEFFITFLILYFVKIFRIHNHDYFDVHSDFAIKLKKIFFVSVLPMSILSNLIHFSNIDMGISLLIGVLVTGITVILLCKTKSVVRIFFIIVASAVSFVIFFGVEVMTFKAVFYFTNTDLTFFQQSFWLSSLLTVFERIIEYLFIFLVLVHKNLLIKVDIFRNIIKSKLISTITCFYILVNMVVFLWLAKLFLTNNFNNLNELQKVFLILIIFFVGMMDISIPYVITMLIQMKDRYRMKYGKEVKL
jgi:hypothetical protein